ncbi:MAG: hypothetical protein LUQ50_10225 [Methanospirillum sp.]|uniref:hypothetical protein n=1 Tax=Methanospirillum sp. TaxID=45200 RepID=UPI00236D2FDC|nr:hypothetical protein [Methanospirillum sp.]MDD1729434.1 hypothetical protein [Methanospirillum sp.]
MSMISGLRLAGFLIVLIVVNVVCISGVIAGDSSQNDHPDAKMNSSLDFIGGEGHDHLNTLLLLAHDLGLNDSYGSEGGTVFSMVDESLTQIITGLSAGDYEGFMDIPLIRETFEYLNLNPADVTVNYNDVDGSLAAIDTYSSRYERHSNVS